MEATPSRGPASFLGMLRFVARLGRGLIHRFAHREIEARRNQRTRSFVAVNQLPWRRQETAGGPGPS
jgi:hypothetical protein